MTPAPTDPQKFITRLQQSLGDGSFVKLTLGRPFGAEPSLDKLLARRLVLRGADHLSLVWRHRTKDITKNLPLADALALLAALLDAAAPAPGVGAGATKAAAPGTVAKTAAGAGTEAAAVPSTGFHHAHLVTRGHDIQLALGKRGQWGLRIGKLAPTAAEPSTPGAAAGPDWADQDPATTHDRPRQHALSLSLPFLAELGVTDAQQRLVPAMARKWKQINKFIEVLSHALAQSPLATRAADVPVRVLDFGAGKGYLTFAVQHHLQASGRLPDVTGVELRDELTQLCNGAVARLGLAGLRFATGDIASFADQGALDIMIALHACDTATDVAMHHGITRGAAIILCSPCCHKQLRPQMTAPAPLQPMLRHGIHMAEQAEMLTDALRALLLQGAGYDTQVFEFISPEHTGKNKMVLAVRRSQPLSAAQRQALQDQVVALKAFYGVREQCLESLLQHAA